MGTRHFISRQLLLLLHLLSYLHFLYPSILSLSQLPLPWTCPGGGEHRRNRGGRKEEKRGGGKEPELCVVRLLHTLVSRVGVCVCGTFPFIYVGEGPLKYDDKVSLFRVFILYTVLITVQVRWVKLESCHQVVIPSELLIHRDVHTHTHTHTQELPESDSQKERNKHELSDMKYYISPVSCFQLHPSDKTLICPISRIFFTTGINPSCSAVRAFHQNPPLKGRHQSQLLFHV